MLDYQSVRTYRDLLQALQNVSDEQLDMPIQCADSHPVDEHVYTLAQAICLGTVDQLNLRYARSVTDNRRNGDELVLFCDGNPFAEDGATGYVMENAKESRESAESLNFRDRLEPIYPDDHDESRDWSGPAQKLVDFQPRKPSRGTLTEILAHRIGKNA